MFAFFFPWGVILQALALVHFIRRRPDTVWLWIIIFFGPIGALVYMAMEVVPDYDLLRRSFDAAGRRRKIKQLEALVLENPAAGNYEELANLHLNQGHFARARECYDSDLGLAGQLDPIIAAASRNCPSATIPAAVNDLESHVARSAL